MSQEIPPADPSARFRSTSPTRLQELRTACHPGADQQSAFGPRGEHYGRRIGRSGGRSVSAGVEWELVADDELAPWPRRCGRHETSESGLFADGRPSVVREDVNFDDPGRRSCLEFAQAGRGAHRRIGQARRGGSGACAGTRLPRFRVQGRADLETAEVELLARLGETSRRGRALESPERDVGECRRQLSEGRLKELWQMNDAGEVSINGLVEVISVLRSTVCRSAGEPLAHVFAPASAWSPALQSARLSESGKAKAGTRLPPTVCRRAASRRCSPTWPRRRGTR